MKTLSFFTKLQSNKVRYGVMDSENTLNVNRHHQMSQPIDGLVLNQVSCFSIGVYVLVDSSLKTTKPMMNELTNRWIGVGSCTVCVIQVTRARSCLARKQANSWILQLI